MSELIKRFRADYLKTKKSLGQHFLTNNHIISEIAAAAVPDEHTPVIEIGPGCGVLTEELSKRTDLLTVIELDDIAVEFLEKNKAEFFPLLNIIHDDATKVDLSLIYPDKFAVAGNLPYNMSVRILEHCTRYIAQQIKLVFMFQKEVAMRITASPGSRDYSSLSIYIDYYYKTRRIRDIGGGNFWPNANVMSTVVEFIPKNEYPLKDKAEENFFAFVRQAFTQKRKTLRNNIKGIENTLQSLGYPAQTRAEELSTEDFLRIYEKHTL